MANLWYLVASMVMGTPFWMCKSIVLPMAQDEYEANRNGSFAQISSIPLGYNNPALAATAASPEMVNALINRPALGVFPPPDWAEILETGILRAAPKGMSQVFTSMTGSDANETAYKAAFIWRLAQERGGRDFTQEEMTSVMTNQAPGAPKFSILSFHGGFHGRLFGSLSTTHSKAIHKLDIPAFDWPTAPFPQLKYPLNEFEAENKAEEDRCLHEVEQILTNFHSPVVATVIEPIQSEGGDNHASPYFFRRLREITAKKNVLLIVDEVQTGVGATGKFWAHEHWDLPSPPDMVTFSKKAQAAGFYYKDESLRPDKPYRQFNTWMGDPARALLFKSILGEIEAHNLVEKTADVGRYLYGGLDELAHRYPEEVKNLRGKDRGTFLAFDSPRRDEVLKLAMQKGVNIGGSGDASIRLRPMLIFQRQHGTLKNTL
jgi:4-aminobutyrate aminotransferase/(S)-3-amino-2-methylpropionate transaminase